MSGIDWSKAPEGATHYREGVATFYKQTDRAYEWNAGRWQLIANDLGEFRWSDQLIDRPSPAWNGEGLPPVGVECEVYHCDDWMTGEVIAHFQQKAGMVAAYTVEIGNGIKHLDCAIAECFRPIRTPEQVAADEREAQICKISDLIQRARDAGVHAGEALYDAGYRQAT